MIYVFDIDGTICEKTKYFDYGGCKPFLKRIAKVNQLYDEGNTIVYQTARGMGRTNNSTELTYRLFYQFTKNQLEEWGVKYHSLFLGKPAGDIYIDDKGIKDEDFFEN